MIGILGDIFFSIFCYFIINAYFLVFCSYLPFRAYFSRRLKFIRPVLAIFILAGCIYGYFDADIDRQKEGVFAGFYRIFSRDLHLRFGRNFCAKQLFDDPLRDHLYA